MKRFIEMTILAFSLVCVAMLGLGITVSAEEGQKVVSILGDSVSCHDSQGNRNSPYPKEYEMKEQETYWMRYVKVNNYVLGKNESVGGSTIKDINVYCDPQIKYFGDQGRIDSLGMNGAPDEIVIFGGLNDDIANVSKVDFDFAYRQLLDKVISKYPESRIVLVIPYASAWSDTNLTNEYANVINKVSSEYLETGKDIVAIDLRNVFDYNNSSQIYGEVHPTKLGHIIIFNKLMEQKFNQLKETVPEIVPEVGYTGFYSNSYGTWYYKNGQIDCSYNGIYIDGTVVVAGYVDSEYNGVFCNNGVYYNVVNGKTISLVNGVTMIDNRWRMVRNGYIDYGYTGFARSSNDYICFKNGSIDEEYSEMAYINGVWRYYNKGRIDWNYTGMAFNEFGWWYFRGGQIDWNYTGEASNNFGTWFFQNGRINFDAYGMQYTGSEWRMLWGGQVCTWYTGMAQVPWGWYYFENGHLSNYTGMACNEMGWWYYKNGVLDWNYTGEASIGDATFFFQKGRINFDAWGMQYTGKEWRMLWGGYVLTSYTGMGQAPWGWYYFENGHLSNYTGMACNEMGWWYYRDGLLDWNYTGLGENFFGKWLYWYGNVAFWYSGPLYYEGHTYYINGGHVDYVI